MSEQPTHPLISAEQAVLGAAMLDSTTISDLVTVLGDDAFYQPHHGLVWQAIIAAHTAGEPTDPIAIATRLTASRELAKVGGAPYLHTLIASVPTTSNAIYYARQVADAAHRRRLTAVGTRLAQAAETPGTDLATVIDSTRVDLTTTETGNRTWIDPVPLDEQTGVPVFPADVLPDWLGDMVSAVSTATQTPPDLAGSLALACLSAATMGRVMVEPKAGWREQTTLFTCVALGPGERKSAVFDAMSAPIHDAERDLAEQLSPLILEATVNKAIAQKKADAALVAAGKPTSADGADFDAQAAARDADDIVVPVAPRLVTNDATPEATKTVLSQQGGRLAILDDEGGLFAQIAGRYSGTPDLDPYLKGHAGGRLIVDRKSAAPEFVPRAALTIGLAVQPAVLRDIAKVPGFLDRGLLARFLFALPTSMVGYRNPASPPVPLAISDGYTRRVKELAMNQWHTLNDAVLVLTPTAMNRVIALETEREPRLRPGGEWEPIATWANKWTGMVVRIAALLHIAEHLGDGWRAIPISADTVEVAAFLGHHYAVHALAVWSHMADHDTGDARLVLDWLTRHRQAGVARRDIHRSLRRRLDLVRLDAALAVLEQYGHIRIHRPTRTGRGRSASPQIHVHPAHIGGTQ